MAASRDRHAILVLGMHRSGTSALAGMLSLCGASLPATLMPPADYNPKGFFESLTIFRAHQELLASLGSSWDDLGPLPRGWLDSAAGEQHVQKMAHLVHEEFGSSPLFVLKDPRICQLIPFWTKVLHSLDIQCSFVFPVRNPLEVAQSLESAQGVPVKKGLLLWLAHFLRAEHDTRSYPRSFISYEQLLSDWRKTAQQITKNLDLQLPRMTQRSGSEVDAFLDSTLKHQAVTTADMNAREDISTWIKDVYGWAERATRGKSIPPTKIDRIAASLEDARSAFSPVMTDTSPAESPNPTRPNEYFSPSEEETAAAREGSHLADSSLSQEAEKDAQIRDLVECVKLMLVWIASRGPGHGTATEELKKLLTSLDSPSTLSLTESTRTGLAIYEESLLANFSTKQQEDEEERRLLQARVNDLKERHEQAQKHLSDARENTIQAESSAREVRDELQRRDRAFSELRTDLHRSSSRVDELQRSIIGYQAEREDLNSRLGRHREAGEQASQLLGKRTKQVKDLQAELQKARERLSSMGPQTQALAEETKKVRGLLNQRNQTLRTLQDEHGRIQKLSQQLGARQKELTTGRKALQEQLDHATREQQRLREELDATRRFKADAIAQSNQQEQATQQQAQKIRELTQQRDAATGEIQKLHGELSRLRRETPDRSG